MKHQLKQASETTIPWQGSLGNQLMKIFRRNLNNSASERDRPNDYPASVPSEQKGFRDDAEGQQLTFDLDSVPLSGTPIVSPASPFLWPESRVLGETHRYGQVPVYANEIKDAQVLFGIVHNLTERGVRWIAKNLSSNENLSVCLVVAIYPACSTTTESLQLLAQFSVKNAARLKVRLKPMRRSEDRVTTNLCVVSRSGASKMIVSPSGDFALGAAPGEFMHLCFATDTALHHQFTSWFEFQWLMGKTLDENSAKMPNLVPAAGDPEADRQWQIYLARLEENEVKETSAKFVTVDPDTGEIIDVNGNRIETVLDLAKVPRPSIAMVQVGKVLHQGSLATIDNSSRVGPLDCPISADLFGVDADRRTGTVSRETKFRVSAIDEKTLKKLEGFRKRTRELLNKMSYPLADGARWVPNTVRLLLEQELHRVNEDGKKLLGETVKDSVKNFVNLKRMQVAADAQTQFAELHPGDTMPEDTVDKILVELTHRLTRATGGKLLPMLSFLDVRIATAPDSDWSTQASQAYRFLVHVAKYPRECLTDPFFMRGVRVDQKELMKAMNVVDDSLVELFVKEDKGIDLAITQKYLIERIQNKEIDDILKCDALYRMMRGDNEEQIEKILASGAKTEKQPETTKPAK